MIWMIGLLLFLLVGGYGSIKEGMAKNFHTATILGSVMITIAVVLILVWIF